MRDLRRASENGFVKVKPPRHEDGWSGAFTREQAPQALFSNGTRVKKTKAEPCDTTPLGALATVLGSYYIPEKGVGYFVEWDDKPRVAVFVVGWKLGPVREGDCEGMTSTIDMLRFSDALMNMEVALGTLEQRALLWNQLVLNYGTALNAYSLMSPPEQLTVAERLEHLRRRCEALAHDFKAPLSTHEEED